MGRFVSASSAELLVDIAVVVVVMELVAMLLSVATSVLHFVVSASGLPSTSVTSTMGPSGSKVSSSSTPLSIAATASS